MKKVILPFLLMTLVLIVQAQQSDKIKTTMGPLNDGKRSVIEQVVGYTPGGIIVIRKVKDDYFLELVSETGNVTVSSSLAEMNYNGLELYIDRAFILKNRLFIRSGARDKKKKLDYNVIDEYDVKTLTFKENISAESITVDNVKTVYWYGIGAARAMSELGENGFSVSNDGNYAVEYSSNYEKEKTTDENLTLRVFDSGMKVKWDKFYTIPYQNELFQIVKVIVDDHGNAHLLGKEYFEKTKGSRRSGIPNYRFHVISFMNNGETVKDNELDIDAKFITDVAIGITSDEFLIASGFYGSKERFSIDGSFYLKIDIQNNHIVTSNKKEFEKEFIQLGMTEKEKKKSDKKEDKGEDIEMPSYDLDRLIITSDGGWLLMAEQFYITTSTYVSSGPNGSMTTRTVYHYHYDDIILVKMNAQGDIAWNIKITKNQSTTIENDRPMLSYSWSSCGDDLYILYNSRPASRENVVTAAIIEKDGTVKTEVAIPAEKDELNFFPRFSSKTKDCQMLIFAARRKNYQFNILNMKN